MKKKFYQTWYGITLIIILSLAVFVALIFFSSNFSSSEPEEEPRWNNENLNIVDEINQNYYSTHTYSSYDFFVCADMAIDVWNLVKTKGIDAKICSGNIDKDISLSSVNDLKSEINYFNSVNHAWVVAEIEPFEFVAVETTGGFLVFDETSEEENVTKNGFYYKSDLCFDSTSEFKKFLDVREDYIETCKKHIEMIDYWNENYVGEYLTSESSEYKGKMELKEEECVKLQTELYALLA